MLNRWFDLATVQAISQIACCKWSQNVLSLGLWIYRDFLSFAKRHEAKVGAIECLVPGLIPGEFILDVRVDGQSILLEDLHTTSVIKLILEASVHLRRAVWLAWCVLTQHLHFSGMFQACKWHWVNHLLLHLDAQIILRVDLEQRLCHIVWQVSLEVQWIFATPSDTPQLTDTSQMRWKPLLQRIRAYAGSINFNKVFLIEVFVTLCQTHGRVIALFGCHLMEA